MSVTRLQNSTEENHEFVVVHLTLSAAGAVEHFEMRHGCLARVVHAKRHLRDRMGPDGREGCGNAAQLQCAPRWNR